MQPLAREATTEEILPLRARFREEMSCQIVHDSIHRRPGWTRGYLLESDGDRVGFASVALAGPWKDKPTVLEFYVLPPHRARAFRLFEEFPVVSGARYFEAQTNDPLYTVLVLTYGSDIVSESIVFRDDRMTTNTSPVAV